MGTDDARRDTVFDRLDELPQVARLVDWTLIDLDENAGTIRVSFTGIDEFRNAAGSVHGGFLATMLDELMGSTMIGATDGRFMPTTTSMTIDFVRPAPTGRILGEGRIVSLAGRTAHIDGQLRDPDGQLLARAVGTYRMLPMPSGVGSA